jgi:hypothetical protein
LRSREKRLAEQLRDGGKKEEDGETDVGGITGGIEDQRTQAEKDNEQNHGALRRGIGDIVGGPLRTKEQKEIEGEREKERQAKNREEADNYVAELSTKYGLKKDEEAGKDETPEQKKEREKRNVEQRQRNYDALFGKNGTGALLKNVEEGQTGPRAWFRKGAGIVFGGAAKNAKGKSGFKAMFGDEGVATKKEREKLREIMKK